MLEEDRRWVLEGLAKRDTRIDRLEQQLLAQQAVSVELVHEAFRAHAGGARLLQDALRRAAGTIKPPPEVETMDFQVAVAGLLSAFDKKVS